MTQDPVKAAVDDAEPPCIGLDPDTDPCPHCGASLDEDCKAAQLMLAPGRPGPIKLTWDNAAPDGVADKVIADIREALPRLSAPSNLAFHTIFLTADRNGPSVFVYGKETSDSFHCKYYEVTEWTAAERRFDHDVHMLHCNQDEWVGTCKYGEDADCPALRIDSWKPGPRIISDDEAHMFVHLVSKVCMENGYSGSSGLSIHEWLKKRLS